MGVSPPAAVESGSELLGRTAYAGTATSSARRHGFSGMGVSPAF
ncbi:MAG: hypothetical protein ACKOBW_11200 [Planctomycetota bacterium]